MSISLRTSIHLKSGWRLTYLKVYYRPGKLKSFSRVVQRRKCKKSKENRRLHEGMVLFSKKRAVTKRETLVAVKQDFFVCFLCGH